jgi:hypothetical protein
MTPRIVPATATAVGCFLALGVSTRAEAGIILQTSTYGGNTYHLVANSGSQGIFWSDAQAYAVTLGGNLTTVNDAAENAWLLSTFQASAIAAQAAAHPGSGLLAMWIGLNDIDAEGTYTWVGGGASSYRNWEEGEPAGGVFDEDVVGMLATNAIGPGGESWSAGNWHDVLLNFDFNDVASYGIVEVNGIIPAPGVMALLGAAGLVGSRRRRG